MNTAKLKRANVLKVAFVAAATMLAACLLAWVGMGNPAEAAFPGTNGKMAFTSNTSGNSEIYVMDSDGSGTPTGTPTNITNSAAADFDPAFSPDGTKIAFVSNRSGNQEIYVMDLEGSRPPTQITNSSAARESYPAFSPDGKKIAFERKVMRTYGVEIVVRNSDGSGTATNLTNNGANNYNPTFSPDGKKIAFDSNQGLGRYSDIFVMNSDGSGTPTNLTNNEAGDFSPAFSPDGKKIVFSSNYSDIYVINSDGSGTATNLTNNPGAFVNSPDWGPAEDNILPFITINTPVSDATYRLGDTVNAEYSCADEPGGSGLNSCVGSVPNGSPIDTTSCPAFSCHEGLSVIATDKAGNKTTKTHFYSVLGGSGTG